MIDTHCHLYVKAFDNDRAEMMQRALAAGVKKFYLPAIDSSCTERITALQAAYPQSCYPMAGLHPCSVNAGFRQEIDLIKKQLSEKRFAGIGETGLDFYWDKTFVDQQYEALQIQAELAIEYNLPLILHTRNATRETIDVIRNFSGKKLRGIFHCFGGSLDEATEIIRLGFHLGIGGVLTYKNAGLDIVLQEIELRHLVLETDAPYLAPVPLRGKRNESSYLTYIAAKLADVKKTSLEEVVSLTTANAENIFGR